MRASRIVVSAAVALALGAGGYATLTGRAGSMAHPSNPGRSGAMDAVTAVQPALPGLAKASSAPATTASPPSTAPRAVGSSAAPTPAGSSRKPVSKPTPTAKPTPKPPGHPTTPPADRTVVGQLLAQINDLRAQHGLPPYTLFGGLNASAHAHNIRMMGSCGMSHQCPGELSLGARISAQGVSWSSCGENIGWSGPHSNTTSAIVAAAKGLTTSMYNEKPPNDGHRKNLLSTQFHHVGIDVVRDSSGKVWLTQDFSS